MDGENRPSFKYFRVTFIYLGRGRSKERGGRDIERERRTERERERDRERRTSGAKRWMRKF
jgi:hypothetical protein